MKTKSNKIIYAILAIFAAIALIFFATFASGCTDNDDNEQSSGSGSGLITGDEVGDGDGTDGDGDTSTGEDNNGSTNGDTSTGEDNSDSTNDDLSKSLVIPVSGLSTSKAGFYGITVDGTYMEVIAFKSGSAYRTAFNTCQVCYGSRRAYYVQSGSYLVCQNCGNRFALSQVGVKTNSYTCSPYPILAGDRSDTTESLIIPYDFLVKAKAMFRTWKVT